MDPTQAYSPTADYNTAYDAMTRRINASYANRLGQTQQGIGARGVATSGVATLAEEPIAREKSVALNGAAGDFALEQARTAVEDRRRAEEFERNKELMEYGGNLQYAMQRRLAQGQLAGQLGAGALGAAGSVAGGYLYRK